MNHAALDELKLEIEQTVEIQAPIEKVFEGLIVRLCELHGEEGEPPVTFKLERWPGGRWYRDLGEGRGHLWGFVQSIKAPTLLELQGPMFLSYPVAGHLMVRLSETKDGTKLVFQNQVFGPIPAEMREGLGEGWAQSLAQLKTDMEQ